MSRALKSRLAKLEGPPRDPEEDWTDEQLDARMEEILQSLGGADAILAELDDSDPEQRRFRRSILEYQEMKAEEERVRARTAELVAEAERERSRRLVDETAEARAGDG
jgi:hypothetical protein